MIPSLATVLNLELIEGDVWIPRAAITDHGVEDDEKLPHAGCLSDALLARIYEVLPRLCPACGGEMRIISFITLPSTVERTLLHLDQSPAFDLAAPEPIPEFDFDQSSPHGWDAWSSPNSVDTPLLR